MNAAMMLKLAAQLSDYSQYFANQQDLMPAFRSGDEAATTRIFKQNEVLKNRHGGMPPPGKMPDPNWRVTVQSPVQLDANNRMPGYQQIDDISGGQNRWSKGPQTLGRAGYNIPDVAKLPQGQYPMGEAAHRLWMASDAGRLSMRPAAHGYPQFEAALALAQKYGPSQNFRRTVTQRGMPLMSAMKSWRRHRQTINPEFNQAFRRFSPPGSALKHLLNSAKYLRL